MLAPTEAELVGESPSRLSGSRWATASTAGVVGLLLFLFVAGYHHETVLQGLSLAADGTNQPGTYADPYTYNSVNVALDPKPAMLPSVNSVWHKEVLKDFLTHQRQNSSMEVFTYPPYYVQEMKKRAAMVAAHNPRLEPLYTPREFNITVSNTMKVNKEIAKRVAMVVKHLPNTNAVYNLHPLALPCNPLCEGQNGQVKFHGPMVGHFPDQITAPEAPSVFAKPKPNGLEAYGVHIAHDNLGDYGKKPWIPKHHTPTWEEVNKAHNRPKGALPLETGGIPGEDAGEVAADAWARKIMGEDGGGLPGDDDEAIPGR